MRYIASFLLLFMALQSAGQLVIFKIQQVRIRQEMKQQIKSGVPDEELILLKIPQRVEQNGGRDFQRSHSREFRYHGKMYDIVRQEKHAAVTWYYCLSDEKETALFANLEAAVRRDMQGTQHREQSDKLLRLISLLFFPVDSDLRYSGLFGQTESIRYFYTVKTWRHSPPSPPPQV